MTLTWRPRVPVWVVQSPRRVDHASCHTASAPDPHPARPLPQLSGQSAQLFPVSAVATWPEMKQETSFLLPTKSRTQGERGRPGRGLSRTRSTEGGVQTQRASGASPPPPSRGLPEVPPRQAEQWAKGQRGPWGGARRRPGPGRRWPPESRRFLPAGAGAGPALTDWPPQPSLSPAAGLGQELLGSCRLGSGPGCSAGWAALPPDSSFELPGGRKPRPFLCPPWPSEPVELQPAWVVPATFQAQEPPRPGVWPLPSLPTALGTTEPCGYYLGPRADALPSFILGTAGSRQARFEGRGRGRGAQRGFPGWQGPRGEGGLWTSSLKWGLQPLPRPRAPWTPSLG